MAKKKILILENSIDVTGALKTITNSAYDLKEYYDFKFIIPKGSRGRFWIEKAGFDDIVELPMKEISKRVTALLLYVPFLLSNTFRLKGIIKRENISMIHVNDLYNLLPVTLALFGNDKPYLCHIRFLPNHFPAWLFNFWLRLHLRYAKKVVAVSQSVLKMLKPHPKLIHIYNELPLIEKLPPSTRQGNRSGGFVFLYLSNFMKGKGQEYAIEAFSKIHGELPNWRLLFVGGDMGMEKNSRYRDSLIERSKFLGIFDKIEWQGFTEDVEFEYKEADVVLNFSESESFSITCLEAQFFGRPIIATDCGGPAEIIDDGKTGYLVPNRDIEAMARAMKELASLEKRRVEMGNAAREVVREKFSFEKTSQQLKYQYDLILDKHD